MEVEKLQMDREHARVLYSEYQSARAHMNDKDRAIAAIYKRIAAGKLVIRALSSITAAGVGADCLPKLAIMRADTPKVQCYSYEGKVTLSAVNDRGQRIHTYAKDRCFSLEMPGAKNATRTKVASVPLIPVHLRPRKALHKYHVLWEADWDQYPVDPYLLRRFGEDAWLVVAAWDLTPIERAVMAQKLSS